MNKIAFKEIVLEILRSESDETFSAFIKKLSEYLSGNNTLKLDGIGHFQVKREPLSRMERRGEESEKEILIFLPEGETSEESILSFEVNSESQTSDKLDDSIFDIGVNRPTVISDSEIYDEHNETRIIEFIESGEILQNFDLLNNVSFSSLKLENEENIDFKSTDIFSKEDLESFGSDEDETTEVKINKDFLIDSDNSELEDDELILDRNEELDIVNNSDDLLEDEEISDFGDSLEDDNISNDDFGVTESKNGNIDNKNPFDELENYIKEDNQDEAQEILDEAPEEQQNDILPNENPTINNTKESKKVTHKRESYSAIRNKSGGILKNPIFYIALSIVIIAIAAIFIFLPTSETELVGDSEIVNLQESNNAEIGIIDSTNLNDSVKIVDEKIPIKEEIKTVEQSEEEKLAEIRKLEQQNKIIPKEEKKQVKAEVTKTVSTEMYREIANEQTITDRIYFDGKRYTVQVSSWKSANIAEKEVNKLKKRGFDAFIFKVFIKTKGSTWNRVRIGYFNSVNEAEEFIKKNKI
ncbi:MAG: SPOR domain-containing protein [Bacteroidetes bacterium]|nr:SPOR domain-containing protein [Bacteroidota bacterium]MBU1115402.1 SPOR domain-containing protein [Bacteroidota bacterium]MBU1797923.1 SPOR domain-containing protein [Bacteroidota bacterium]